MVGDNLTSYANLEYFSGNSPKEVIEQLRQIRMPYKIVAAYAQGVNHIFIVSLSNPIKKTRKKKVNSTLKVVK